MYKRQITPSDAAAAWRLVEATPELDHNSFYLYHLLASRFADTCAVVDAPAGLAGLATGFRRPDRPDTLFVWQVATAAEHRGRGIARRLVGFLAGLPGIEAVEATIAPGNLASQAVFRSVAAARGWALTSEPYLSGADVPSEAGPHEDELLFTLSGLTLSGRPG